MPAVSEGVLVLASRSPRRAQLLRENAIPFVQLNPPFNDPITPEFSQNPEKLTITLSRRKALSAIDIAPSQYPFVLGADTIVVAADGELLGQPRHAAEAKLMLDKLLGCWHRVVTGVVLLDRRGNELAAFADEASVKLGPVDKSILDQYMQREAWRGKAGAYNLAEIEGRWPMQVRGDPATVVGLPMCRLLPVLRELGVGARPSTTSGDAGW